MSRKYEPIAPIVDRDAALDWLASTLVTWPRSDREAESFDRAYGVAFRLRRDEPGVVAIVAGSTFTQEEWESRRFLKSLDHACNGEDSEPEQAAGVKHDGEKPQYDLLVSDMPLALEEVVLVLTDGARKYAPANWERVENAERRYQAAGLRHEVSHAQGEPLDDETGRHHLAHKICCDLFRLELMMREERDHG